MTSTHKLAIVTPYRDREAHLRQFLPHIKRYLQQQQIDYHVYIVEQEAGKPFNKGVLMNAGYREADADSDYFVFHDVDQLPQHVDYGYQPNPTHLAAAVSQFNYQLPYETLFGGAVLFNRSAFEQVNGYSNGYWGWGGEDDDMICRCRFAGLEVQRQSTGIFQSLDHDRTRDQELFAGNVNRLKDMQDGRVDWRNDGLNSCCYRVISKETSEDQTWIKVALPDAENGAASVPPDTTAVFHAQDAPNASCIPRTIHQLWRDADLPPRYAAFAQTWRQHHPDWEYRLWTDGDLRQLVATQRPDLLSLYDGFRENISRADLGRYVVLQTVGGVYADLDCECLRPIDALLPESGLALAHEPGSHSQSPKAVQRGIRRIPCPSFLASEPEHPFWDDVFDDIWAAPAQADVLDASGPFLLARALSRYDGPRPIHDLPTEAIYPVTKEDCWTGRIHDIEFWERTTRNAHIMHYWDGAWFPHPTCDSGLPANVDVGLLNESVPPAQLQNQVAPTVSCLMVTRGRVQQVREAIACFVNQTYEHKELVIVTEAPDPELREEVARIVDGEESGNSSFPVSIRLLAVGERGLTLGELRNYAVDHAQGELVCQWDDDDLYDPSRLSMQVHVLQQSGAHACMLQRWLIWWPENQRLAVSTRRPWEGSLMALKSVMPRYPALRRGEDSPLVAELLRSARVAIFDLPRLYVYTAHGGNTFQSSHFDEHWTAATARFTGTRYHDVLTELGKRLPTLNEPVSRALLAH